MNRVYAILQNDIPPFFQTLKSPLTLILREGFEEEFKEPRSYAYSTTTDDNYIIVVSPKMDGSSVPRIKAILRHELGHVYNFWKKDWNHSEQDADDIAEKIWGDKIYYDSEDIQTLDRGKYPRPRYLHS